MRVVDLDDLRGRGIRLIAIGGWLFAAFLAAGMAAGLFSGGFALLTLALAVNGLPTAMALRRRHDLAARQTVSVLAVICPAILVYALKGRPWQMDMHMFFFVGLAGLTILCDWRSILLASVLVMVHHLVLDYVAPEWLFEGSSNLGRVLIHAAAVTLQCALLGHVSYRLRNFFRSQDQARAISEQLAQDADISRLKAQAALATAEEALAAVALADDRTAAEYERRMRLEQGSVAEREAYVLSLAARFESSIYGIVTSVGSSASQLDATAKSLSGLANDSGRQSAAVAQQANDASRTAGSVERSVAELALSIAGISARIDKQAMLSEQALTNSITGDDAVRTLIGRATDIGEFTGRIGSIASHTRMLAVNAKIEAAHAGAAGRGFGVVANEVKSLAAQATIATVEIRALVDGVHCGARVAEDSLNHVSLVVEEIADATAAIRVMLAEQHETAQLLETSARQSAEGADKTAERMGEVAAVANEAGELSLYVRSAAGDLLDQSVALQMATRTFIEQLKAA